MHRHFFFDLDNTVTRSRTEISSLMRAALSDLVDSGYDVVIVSGAKVEQALKQTQDFPCYYLGQNGNHAYDGSIKSDMWRNTLTEKEKTEIMEHILSIPRTWAVADEDDLIQDRECQISYSLLGHNEELSKKEAFDPDFSKRKQLLAEHPLVSDTVEIKMGGTTCLDYVPKGKHKGYNVAMLLRHLEWKKEECLYIGDALFPGGNDEAVVGVIDTKQVANPSETLEFLRSVLGPAK